MAHSQDVFQANHTYVILANNGNYLNRILGEHERDHINYIEAAKPKIDLFCRFRASLLGEGTIALKADDGSSKYVTRFRRGEYNNIEAAKDAIDASCEFQVETDNTGPPNWNGARYVYLKADNGKYWGIVHRGRHYRIEANATRRNDETRFIVLEAR